MCLILIAHRTNEAYPLLVAANRDEFHARPTAPAAFWEDHPQLFAGRDLQAGGTWMGVSRDGRFAAITNYRDPERTLPAERSRGELTSNYLTGDVDAETYLWEVARSSGAYAGFNLLLAEAGELWYLSSSAAHEAPQRLSPGVYGLSNASLDTPWPKVVRGKQVLRDKTIEIPNHDGLASAVSSRALASRAQLQGNGLEEEMDELLSAQFIVNPTYGTRATTTLWQDAQGKIQWRETGFSNDGEPTDVIEQTL